MGRLRVLSTRAQVLYDRMQEVEAEKKVRDDKRNMCVIKRPKSKYHFKGLEFGEQ